MINYEYTDVNRLDAPHKYMYTPYKGNEFLDSYFKDRLKCLKCFRQKNSKEYKNKDYLLMYLRVSNVLKLFLDGEFSDEFYESFKMTVDWEHSIKLDDSLFSSVGIEIADLSTFNIDSEINSEKLLVSLLNSQLNEGDENLIKFWLDLFVQRFEVTKKIYERYPIHFSKGKGKNNIIRLYWLFALSLSVFYSSSKNIKYLSTLLKIMDLLCSLDIDLLNQDIPPQGLSTILLIELLSVKSLTKVIEGRMN